MLNIKLRYYFMAAFAALALVLGNVSYSNAVSQSSYTITGVDLHDGTVQKFGSTYYMYGTMYNCGYSWGVPHTTWCGFGVSTATSLAGPWSAPTQLFSPNDKDTFTNTTWQTECGATGAGCFNPRMIQRTWDSSSKDGVYILWFNSPADYTRNHANAYNAMGCNGPTGGCGQGAGIPSGSYHKPSMYICSGNGDFSIITPPDGSNPVMVCTMPGEAQLRTERLDNNGTNGNSTGQANLAGLSKIEGPGIAYDAASGKYILTYSDPSCGYCTGIPTGYAVGTSPQGPFTSPGKAGWGTFPAARRDFDPNSCGGQPRTAFTVDGKMYEWIDTWKGTRNEAGANVQIEEITYTPSNHSSGDGQPWTAEINSYNCH